MFWLNVGDEFVVKSMEMMCFGVEVVVIVVVNWVNCIFFDDGWLI